MSWRRNPPRRFCLLWNNLRRNLGWNPPRHPTESRSPFDCFRTPPCCEPAPAPECAPGEWSVSSRWPAEPRTAETTACASDLAARMERIAAITEESLPEDFRAYTGALASPEGNDLLRLLPETPRDEARELLAPVLGPERSCQVVGILLPKDARFVGFQYEAADLGARGGLLPRPAVRDRRGALAGQSRHPS